MKIEKSNNPVAVGALVLVLILIVGRIGWMLFGHSQPVSAATSAAATDPVVTAPAATPSAAAVPPPVAATPAAPAPDRTTVSARPNTRRNPFSRVTRPVLAARQPVRVGEEDPRNAGALGIAIAPLSPMPIQTGEFRRAEGIGITKLPRIAGAPSLPSQVLTPRETAPGMPEKPKDLQMLKLTAIVGGAQPMAILQTAHSQPVVVHVGDSLAGMRVVAIRDGEIVFDGKGNLWTIPLESSVDKSAPGPVSVAPASASEENINELH